MIPANGGWTFRRVEAGTAVHIIMRPLADKLAEPGQLFSSTLAVRAFWKAW